MESDFPYDDSIWDRLSTAPSKLLQARDLSVVHRISIADDMSYILKTTNELERYAYDLLNQEKLATLFFKAPRLYASKQDGDQMAILLQDLCFLQQFPTALPISNPLYRQVIATIARFHRTFWNSTNLQLDQDSISTPFANPPPQSDVTKLPQLLSEQNARTNFEHVRQCLDAMLPDTAENSTLRSRVAGLLDWLVPRVIQRIENGPKTLIHGDLHMHNLFVDVKEDTNLETNLADCGVYWIDFASFKISFPVYDVAYFLGGLPDSAFDCSLEDTLGSDGEKFDKSNESDLDRARRKRKLATISLIRYYHTCLVVPNEKLNNTNLHCDSEKRIGNGGLRSNEIENYSWQSCLDDFRLAVRLMPMQAVLQGSERWLKKNLEVLDLFAAI